MSERSLFRSVNERPPGLSLFLLLVYISIVMALMRLIDFVILLPHLKLLRVYVRTWRGAYTQSPFTENNFEKVQQARAKGRSLGEFTYGETPVVSARKALRLYGVSDASCVYDVGAGRGRVLIAARLLGAQAMGCDLLAAHVRSAGPALAEIGAELVHKDALEVSFEGVTHVFAAWTCFTQASRKRTAKHFESVAPGTRLLLLDNPLESEAFKKIGERKIWCSWGRATLFVYERLPMGK